MMPVGNEERLQNENVHDHSAKDPGGVVSNGETFSTNNGTEDQKYAEILAFVNYSEIYATFFSCLIRESNKQNVSLDKNFWLLFIYQTFHAPHLVNNNATYINASDVGGVDEDNVAGIIMQHCLTQSSIQSTPRPYLLVWWQQFLWTSVFGVMMAMAVGGNILVMWIIWAHRRMRTITNYFLLNLSLADLFMSVLNCMFNFIYMLHSDWPFGAIYCTISNFMANVTIAASVFTLMAISFDRYMAIVRPLEPRLSKTTARIVIILVWFSSMLLALPCALYSTTVSVTYKDDEVRRGCILRWPDGITSSSRHEHIYNIVFFITTYLLPMLVMLACYYLIGRELWGTRTIGELTDRQLASIRSKRRVVKMFIVIVSVFGICWLPQQAFFLYTFHDSRVLDSAHIQHVYLTFYWLAMANSMINPVIYYWMNARFRSYFREIVVGCVCFRCTRNSMSTYQGSPTLQHRHFHPQFDNPSSRSKSDTRQAVNGTQRTLPVTRSKHHLLLYPSKELLSPRKGLVLGGGGSLGIVDRNGSGGVSQCDECLQTLQPGVLNGHCAADVVGYNTSYSNPAGYPLHIWHLHNTPISDHYVYPPHIDIHSQF